MVGSGKPIRILIRNTVREENIVFDGLTGDVERKKLFASNIGNKIEEAVCSKIFTSAVLVHIRIIYTV